MAGQDEAAVSWEPRFAMPTLDWQTVFTGLAVGLAIFGIYRFLTWLVARRRAQTGWKSTRYLWPAAMLAAQWTFYLIARRGQFTWLTAGLVSVLGSGFWYGVIRLMEWRNELTESTLLHLSETLRK